MDASVLFLFLFVSIVAFGFGTVFLADIPAKNLLPLYAFTSPAWVILLLFMSTPITGDPSLILVAQAICLAITFWDISGLFVANYRSQSYS
jgi:hypothetical protein